MRLALAAFALAALGCATAVPHPGIAPMVFEPSRTPVKPVPADRWGELRPWRILKDTTWLRGEPGDTARFHDLAISGGYLFAATGQGFEIYDVSDPDRPRIVSYADGSALAPVWGFSDKNFFLTSIDAASDDLVVTGAEDFGLIVWNTTVKRTPRVHYQDASTYVRSVAVVEVGGKRLAFGASNSDLIAYDLDAAAKLDRCVEPCPGVKLGVVATGSASALVSAWDRWVLYRDGARLRIFDANPAAVSDFLRLSATLTGVSAVGEASGWEHRGRLYLAVAVANASKRGELWIYDVTCIRAGVCSLPEPVKYDTPDLSAPVQPLNVDVSFGSDGTPYVYVGTNVVGVATRPVCVEQREYLFEARDVHALRDVTPRVPGKPFWGWYYEPCYGFNEAAPRHAVLNGDVVYRTVYSFLDSHRLARSPLIFGDGFESGDTSKWNGR